MIFSDSTFGQGIVEQTRSFMRVDATQWPVAKIVASTNNYLDTLAGYAIGADQRFQWDNTNHTTLPIGTTNIVANQSDYSFLVDEQSNAILTLTRLEILDSTGHYRLLDEIDQSELDVAIDELQLTAGLPDRYDKIADNIVRLYPKPLTAVTAGLKFYFQRTSPYFVATDTTKSTGFAPILDRGFVIAAAYDGALTLNLPNLGTLATEMQREQQKMIDYFGRDRNQDVRKRMSMRAINPR